MFEFSIALLGVIHESRKRGRMNEDGSFIHHQKGPITSTFASDWFLRRGREENCWENG
jgi:hypothetical protein